MNEFEIIKRFAERLPPAPSEVLTSIGDDCAVVLLGGKPWIAASDMLVEGRHFRLNWSSPEDAGYKAVAINVSDVAAMGGDPRFILVSGGAPDPDVASRCLDGVLAACLEFGVYPLGGDTTGADALTVDVAILGELEGEPVLRSGARSGDRLAVTGDLGAAAAGLLALEGAGKAGERLAGRHRRPLPRVDAGRLAARLGARAMIDLSDGLASDIRHICERSGVGCVVELERLPVAADTRETARAFGKDPELLAATGGEDYELLIAASRAVIEELSRKADVPVTVIGEVAGAEAIFKRGGEVVKGLSGWDHFPVP